MRGRCLRRLPATVAAVAIALAVAASPTAAAVGFERLAGFAEPGTPAKYNRVGEKRGGPAPRGLDRMPLEVSGGSITVDTGNIVQGPPIGVDTTGQGQEGAPCV